MINQIWDSMPKWLSRLLSLLVALGLSLGFASQIEQPSLLTWVVAVLNGFLIAGTALGLNQAVKKPEEDDRAPARSEEPALTPGSRSDTFGGSTEAEQKGAPAPAPEPPARQGSGSRQGWRRSWL